MDRIAGLPALHAAHSQHKLAMLYLIDAICSQGKASQTPAGEKLRTKLRKVFGDALPGMVENLATPCNCQKVQPLCSF